MARVFYRMSIANAYTIDRIEMVNNILGIESDSNEAWSKEITAFDFGYFNFIDYFLNILDGNLVLLEDMGITRDNIAIWMLYEYEDQCNLEFRPDEMRRMGEVGITLCISCWEK